MKLIEIWKADLEKAYDLQTSFLKDENGFVNSFSGSLEDFKSYVSLKEENAKGKNLPESYVPSTVYLIEENGNYVGILNFRHELNDFLRKGPGHIGFGIRQEYRGNHYASKALELAKEIALEKGIDELYLSCNIDNVASRKVQMNSGAYLSETTKDHHLFRIPLKRKITIMVACHKESETPKDKAYLPIQVGAFGKKDITYVRDDSGENISKENNRYCELTGLYWCSRHIQSDIIGLVHYRRYFVSPFRKKEKELLKKVLSEKEILSLMKKYQVLVPKKRNYYIQTLEKHYADTFTSEHFQKTREILSERCAEYLPCFDRVMKSRSAYMFNMFIMSQEKTNRYLQWLFPILEELDKRVDSHLYTPFEKRYLGRVSERLWNVWLAYEIQEERLHQEEIKEIPYAYAGKIRWGKKISSFLLAKLFHKKYKESF